MRSTDPTDLNFVLDEDFLNRQTPDFKFETVDAGDRRHLIVYTSYQLELLAQAKVWYMDATFHVVKAPLSQMFSIHAFIQSTGQIKQVPLIFVFMSGRKQEDYYQVLRKIDHLLPPQIALTSLVADFEIALWQAIRRRFPDFEIRGCNFHWAQAVFRKVKENGLQNEYFKKNAIYTFLRKLMTLPYLPEEKINTEFNRLKRHAPEDVRIIDTTNYVERTWITGRVFSPKDWSVYFCSIRTNNDVDRQGSVPFYLILEELYKEASSLPMTVQMLSESKLRRSQRKNVKDFQARVFQLWRAHSNSEMRSRDLLDAVSKLAR